MVLSRHSSTSDIPPKLALARGRDGGAPLFPRDPATQPPRRIRRRSPHTKSSSAHTATDAPLVRSKAHPAKPLTARDPHRFPPR